MKKLLFVLILVTHLVFGVFCQSNSSGPIDLVVLLDTSASMSGSYRETSNYLIGPFLKEFLRIGDTFHLISFSGTPKLEISRRIEGSGDVETIIARMLLMYPLDPESNLSGALSFAESFASSLSNRSKKIVLISDGDAENTQNLVNASSTRFRGLGADLQYIKVPVTGDGPSSGRAAPAQTAASQSAQTAQQGTQSSQTAQTAQQGTQTSQSGQTAQAAQTAQQGAQTSQSGQTAQAAQTAQQGAQSSQTAQTAQQGAQTSQTEQTTQTAQATEGARPSGSTQETQSTSQAGSSQTVTTPTQGSGISGPAQIQGPAQGTGQTQTSQSSAGIIGTIPMPLTIGLALLLLLIIIAIIIFASRRLHSSPNRVISKAASPASAGTKAGQYAETRKTDQLEHPPVYMRPLPKDKVYDEPLSGDGPVMLNLFVEDQNTAIGKRNIHAVKSGYSFTIGGGNSDFLIFLVPIPQHIAEVRLDSRNCTFIPVKPQYFPDIGSNTIPNCIGKTIRVISDKNYELHIRLERYEDPLNALNKMLRSIKVPGPVV